MDITNIYTSENEERLYSVRLSLEEMKLYGEVFGKPWILKKAEEATNNKIPAVKKIDEKIGFKI